MKKIIILDFSDGQVLITNFDTEVWRDPEGYVVYLGCDVNNSQWMVVDDLNIKIEC